MEALREKLPASVATATARDLKHGDGEALPFEVRLLSRDGDFEVKSRETKTGFSSERKLRNLQGIPLSRGVEPNADIADLEEFGDDIRRRLVAVHLPLESTSDADKRFLMSIVVPETGVDSKSGQNEFERSVDLQMRNPLDPPMLLGAECFEEILTGMSSTNANANANATVSANANAEVKKAAARNALYFSEEAVQHSLRPLFDANAELLRVPPGLEDCADSILDLLQPLDSSEDDVEDHVDLSGPSLEELANEVPNAQMMSSSDMETMAQRQAQAEERRARLLRTAEALLIDSDDDFDDDDEDLESVSSNQRSDRFLNIREAASQDDDASSGQPNEPEDDANETASLDEWEGLDSSRSEMSERHVSLSADDADADIAGLEAELETITKETARLATKDLFGSGPRFLRQRAAELSAKTEEFVETRPLDTSAFHQVIPNPALRFPFELDQFQKEAIMHIERHESVFVAAHTSAGKTVCCDYAIALALRNRTKCIYTSPIKALSNQKFRDFSERFGADNVGLITGDVSINPTASCLVVTTEILRSMLYRSADMVSEIETVVFDEIHYICDPDRGVVWEETLIMLSPDVTLVFLSATSPNSVEFAGWVGRIKQQKVYVVFTEKRPIPLEHWIWAPGKQGEHLFKVLDAKKQFLKDGYLKAKNALKQVDEDETAKNKRGTGANPASKKQQKQQAQAAPKRKGFNPNTDRQNWLNLVKDLEQQELLPAVVFAFSKKMCDERASWLQSLTLTNSSERHRIHVVFHRALNRLQGSDRELPQVLRVKELVDRGIGVHHGGLLPILKEVVEILFSEGLVKVLFATETFAIGVNMPARCVVFAGTRKHDGVQFRDLTPGEYTQMAGRAGRRGLDTVGTVIIYGAGRELQPIDVLNKMMTGSATRLTSQFRLTYAMILRLLRAAELSVADMIKRSFSEFGSQKLIGGRDIVSMIERGEEKLQELRNTLGLQDTNVSDFQKQAYAMQSRIGPLVQAILSGQFGTKQAALVLPVGRVLLVSKGSVAGLCVACVLKPPRARGQQFSVLILDARRPRTSAVAQIEGPSRDYVFHVEKVKTRNIVWMSSLKLDTSSAGSVPAGELGALGAALAPEFVQFLESFAAPSPADASRRVPGPSLLAEVPPMDPVSELKLGEVDFVHAYRDACSYASDLASSPCLTDLEMQEDFIKQKKVTTLELKLRDARRAISDENLALFPDFQARLHVLERLGYITHGDRAVQLKGRVACEINTCDELILTEMVFADVFGPLRPEECAAVCSALVMQKKCDDEPILTENLEYARDKMTKIAERLDSIQRYHRIEMNEQDDRKLNFALMEAVYQWARGMPFKQLMNFTSLEEGFIVRTVTRLDETCREVRNIAQLIGDAELFAKMEEASRLIKRDIVFAASLYVT